MELAEKIWADFGEFFELLCHIVEPDDAKAFAENLAPNSLIAAKEAFFLEWTDFFRNLQRPEAAAVLEKLMMLHKKALEMTVARLADDRTKGLDMKAERLISQRLNDAFGTMGGVVGLDPRPFTWRQLETLAKGKRSLVVALSSLIAAQQWGWRFSAIRRPPLVHRHRRTGTRTGRRTALQPRRDASLGQPNLRVWQPVVTSRPEERSSSCSSRTTCCPVD